jgi:hypothetical protein
MCCVLCDPVFSRSCVSASIDFLSFNYTDDAILVCVWKKKPVEIAGTKNDIKDRDELNWQTLMVFVRRDLLLFNSGNCIVLFWFPNNSTTLQSNQHFLCQIQADTQSNDSVVVADNQKIIAIKLASDGNNCYIILSKNITVIPHCVLICWHEYQLCALCWLVFPAIQIDVETWLCFLLFINRPTIRPYMNPKHYNNFRIAGVWHR